MSTEFRSVDREVWKSRITSENWNDVEESESTAHLVSCLDCQTSLFQYLEAREFLDYHSHPCFHVAYHSANVPQRCLDLTHGMYCIITEYSRSEGILIGFCPWCGITLPTGI